MIVWVLTLIWICAITIFFVIRHSFLFFLSLGTLKQFMLLCVSMIISTIFTYLIFRVENPLLTMITNITKRQVSIRTILASLIWSIINGLTIVVAAWQVSAIFILHIVYNATWCISTRFPSVFFYLCFYLTFILSLSY